MFSMPVVFRELDRNVSPFGGFHSVFRDFDNFFIGPRFGEGSTSFPLPVNITANDKEFVVTLDVPGVRPDEIAVDLVGNRLTVKAEKKPDVEGGNDGKARLVERHFGKFSRTLTVPEGVTPEGVEAKYEHGVLELRIAKPAETQRTQIKVRAL